MEHICCICKKYFPCVKGVNGYCCDYEEIGRDGIRFYCPFCWVDETTMEDNSHKAKRKTRKKYY